MAIHPDVVEQPLALPPAEAVAWGVVRASAVAASDRRFEATAYLSDGYGLRKAIEARQGWMPIGRVSEVWQPSRLKGITVAPDRGVPFLAAGQVFEANPTPRKFLSLKQTPDAEKRFVEAGWLLVSCSGEVGKVTVAHSPHVGRLITHDLLRVQPHEANQAGWMYGYMRTSAFRSIAVATHYGHVIKHIEPDHLARMPMVTVNDALAADFTKAMKKVFAQRDAAHLAEAAAFDAYANALAPGLQLPPVDQPTSIKASEALSRRRRLDGYYYNPAVSAISDVIQLARGKDRVADITSRIFAPNRFTREFGPRGVPYRSAEELFDLNAPVTKRVYAGLVENRDDYMLQPGWMVMACSGQIYGLNGAVMLLNDAHRGVFATHDLIRIIPDPAKVRPGYLLAALGHPALGRQLVIRHAYGTSIPHLDVIDVREILIARLDPSLEDGIGAELERVASLRAEADRLENELTARAESILEAFLHGEAPKT